MSAEHFTVDGTLIEAWASHKSFQRKDDGGDSEPGSGGDFHGEKRSNQTHESKTDPEARLYKKSAGQEAKLSYLGHVVVESRHGLIAGAMTTQADGSAERDAALLMLDKITARNAAANHGGSRQGLRHLGFRFHGEGIGSDAALDSTYGEAAQRDRPKDHAPSRIRNQQKQALVSREAIRMAEANRALRKAKLRGRAKVDWLFVFSCAAFNLLRIPKLRERCA